MGARMGFVERSAWVLNPERSGDATAVQNCRPLKPHSGPITSRRAYCEGVCPARVPRTLEVLLPLQPEAPFNERGRRWPHPSWMYCQIRNSACEPIFVYGPRHPSVKSSLPTSLFLLPEGQITPSRWDCKGILIPADRYALNGTMCVTGPAVLKYRDLRRVRIGMEDGAYRCPRSNGFMAAGHAVSRAE